MTIQINSAHPTGRLPVGVTTYQLVDASRPEMFSDDPAQRRELALQIWYPASLSVEAQPLSGKSALPWGSLICPPRSMAVNEYPQFFEQIAELVQTRAESLKWPKLIGVINSHAYPHAPLLKTSSPYPVVLFSHGNGGFLAQTSYLMEELASHGYIVIAIAHSYNTPVNVFPDGRILLTNFDHPLYKTINEEFDKTGPILDAIKKSDSTEFRKQRNSDLYVDGEIKTLMPTYFRLVQTRCADLIFTIDELHRLANDPDWFLEGALDLNRLAAIGYSLGGEAVSQTCVTEHRIKVGIALDSDLWGNMFGQRVSQPFFCIYAESNERDTEYITDGPAIIIRGTKHASFGTGAYWWTSQGDVGKIGTLATARCHEVTRQYVLAFLNHHLCGITDNILHGSTPSIPEVNYLAASLV